MNEYEKAKVLATLAFISVIIVMLITLVVHLRLYGGF